MIICGNARAVQIIVKTIINELIDMLQTEIAPKILLEVVVLLTKLFVVGLTSLITLYEERIAPEEGHKTQIDANTRDKHTEHRRNT
jgi:hypothetical protein